MLFTLTLDKQAMLRPECYQLAPMLKSLDAKQMLYIILAYDYHGPYHQLPREEARRSARVQVYGSLDGEDPEKSDLMYNAIRSYMSLQYDSKRSTIQVYIEKTKRLQHSLLGTESSTEINKILKSITLLEKASEELQKEVDKDEDMLQLEGDGKLSLLEKMQQSKKIYKMHNANVPTENKAEEVLSESNS